jgi:hypothetical protein
MFTQANICPLVSLPGFIAKFFGMCAAATEYSFFTIDCKKQFTIMIHKLCMPVQKRKFHVGQEYFFTVLKRKILRIFACKNAWKQFFNEAHFQSEAVLKLE